MAAKTKRVGHDDVQLRVAGMIRNIIQIAFRILIFQIDRRRDFLMFERQSANDRFDAANRAQQMARSSISSS